LLAECGSESDVTQYGPNPTLPDQQRGLLPSMTIADPQQWADRKPTVPQGYSIAAIVTGLKVPRQTLVLPNGDILVAEGKGGGDAPVMRPKDFIAGFIKKKGTSSAKGGDRLTLLRDANGDGTYEGRWKKSVRWSGRLTPRPAPVAASPRGSATRPTSQFSQAPANSGRW
jgi:glucose/arabinose dehydrogenase